MRLLYLDESGVSDLRTEPHVVVAGPLIDADRHFDAITNDLAALARRYVPPENVEHFKGFHATELFNGNGKVFRRPDWPIERTLPIIRGVLRTFLRNQLPVVYGASDRQRYYQNQWPNTYKHDHEAAHAMAFLQCLMRANRWMRTHGKPGELAMVVVEDKPEMRQKLRIIQTFLQWPDERMARDPQLRENLPLERIIESVVFVQKGDSTIMPLADMAAYILKRRVCNYRLEELFNFYLAPVLDRGTTIENDPIRAAMNSLPKFTCRRGYGRMVPL